VLWNSFLPEQGNGAIALAAELLCSRQSREPGLVAQEPHAVLGRKRRNRYPHSAECEELADALGALANTDDNLQQLT